MWNQVVVCDYCQTKMTQRMPEDGWLSLTADLVNDKSLVYTPEIEMRQPTPRGEQVHFCPGCVLTLLAAAYYGN